jgi:hypothetical protein
VERDVASAIAAIGDVVSPETLDASRAVYAEVFHLNTDDRLLGDQIAAFVQSHAPARQRSGRV